MVTFNTDFSGGKFTNDDLNPRSVVREGETNYTGNITSARSGNAGSTNSLKLDYGFLKSLDPSSTVREGESYSMRNINNISPIDVKLANMQARSNQALGNLSEYEKDFLNYWNASGGDIGTAKRFADQNAQKKADASMFTDNPTDVSVNESSTYNPLQAMADASPLTSLIKGIFGVDEFTGTFQRSRDEINDPHGDSSKLGQNAIAQMTMMGIPPEIATSVIASTNPQPSPNPEGLYIRPNMLNQVPDSYSQAFKDANQSYMQNVAVRPSDFREKMDLRGFEKLQGLLDA